MINIRTNVFETNSSSSHSISLQTGRSKTLSTIEVDKDGKIILNGGDFASAELDISSSIRKVNFIATYIAVYNNKELKNLFEKVVLEHTGASEITYDIRLQSTDDALVNTYFSQEYGEPNCWDYEYNEKKLNFEQILKDENNLKQFLFNDNWAIVACIECCY